MTYRALKNDIQTLRNKRRAVLLQRFFKTAPGEYGEGDVFLGLTVPECRRLAKNQAGLQWSDIRKLLHSRIHEERLIALLILVDNFERGDERQRRLIYERYIRSTQFINNWDLVDLSAHKIVGSYLLHHQRSVLYTMAKKQHLWTQRIAVIATLQFIQHGQFEDALKIAKILLNHEHDLIHKAVGWMLREVGKRDLKAEENFLKQHYRAMPRTMLRYAIERFPERTRKAYLKGII